MGNVYARHTSPSSQVRLLLMGPASAGKTTILYRLRLGEVVTTIPTLGFNVETLTHRTTVFTAWDVGGRDKVRPLWRHYYQGTDAVMFVVDSADRGDSLEAARDEFRRALNEEELAGKPVLLFCNKQDLPGALSPAEVAERLGFYSSKIHDRPLLVLPCCATKGEGLREGLEWIRNAALAKGGGPANPKGTKVNGPSPGPTKSAAGATSGNDPSESLGYDPSENITLRRFAPIKLGTECPFAKASKLWGGIPGDGRSPEEQARADAGPLREFVRRCARKNERLDGFCVDLDGPAAGGGGKSRGTGGAHVAIPDGPVGRGPRRGEGHARDLRRPARVEVPVRGRRLLRRDVRAVLSRELEPVRLRDRPGVPALAAGGVLCEARPSPRYAAHELG